MATRAKIHVRPGARWREGETLCGRIARNAQTVTFLNAHIATCAQCRRRVAAGAPAGRVG